LSSKLVKPICYKSKSTVLWWVDSRRKSRHTMLIRRKSE
jgi:hypothetical protein